MPSTTRFGFSAPRGTLPLLPMYCNINVVGQLRTSRSFAMVPRRSARCKFGGPKSHRYTPSGAAERIQPSVDTRQFRSVSTEMFSCFVSLSATTTLRWGCRFWCCRHRWSGSVRFRIPGRPCFLFVVQPRPDRRVCPTIFGPVKNTAVLDRAAANRGACSRTRIERTPMEAGRCRTHRGMPVLVQARLIGVSPNPTR